MSNMLSIKAANKRFCDEAAGTPGSPATFEKSLPIQVARLRTIIVRRFRAVVENLEEHGLTEQQWRTLNALSEVDEIEVMNIGRRCVILPGSMARIIAKLVGEGLVNRRVDSTDARRFFVSLSQNGRTFHAQMRKYSEAVHREIFQDLGTERLAAFQQILNEVIERLDRKG
jgi:homoprotocatechuate degradation regulator HpaR